MEETPGGIQCIHASLGACAGFVILLPIIPRVSTSPHTMGHLMFMLIKGNKTHLELFFESC